MEALLHYESQCGRRSLIESHLTTYCLILYRWQSFIDATKVTSAVEQAFARPCVVRYWIVTHFATTIVPRR